jgi:hypothetical protein
LLRGETVSPGLPADQPALSTEGDRCWVFLTLGLRGILGRLAYNAVGKGIQVELAIS